MILINNLIKIAESNGYKGANINTKVAQDIILIILSKIEYNRNVTLKGGVLMRSISNDSRRATKDLDIDLIKYSLEDVAIRKIINKMNGVEDIEVSIDGDIKELHHEDYKGKEVHLILKDKNGMTLNAKIDLGVQADLTIEQEEYCFDVGLNDNGVMILANTKEQMFVEKLFSLLKWDIASTRFKDVYDMYFLTKYLNKERVINLISKIILSNKDLNISNLGDISKHLIDIFNNTMYLNNLKNPKFNWINIETHTVTNSIIEFLNSLNIC